MSSRVVAIIPAVLLLASGGSATLHPDGSTGHDGGGVGGSGGSGGSGGKGGTGGSGGGTGGSGTGGNAGTGGATTGTGGAITTGGTTGTAGATATGGTTGTGGSAGAHGTGGVTGTGGTATGGTTGTGGSAGGCVGVANGTTCSDGNICTQTDTCQNGTCTGSNPVVCPTSGMCKIAGTCDPATGSCSAQTNAANGTSCNDGDPCTSPDTCMSGTCLGTQISCTNSPACKQNTVCSAGSCNYTTNLADGTMDSKCGSATPYCLSGSCVRCTIDSHCMNAATPSCDPATHTCVCRRPMATNLLTNPGFDGTSTIGFTGWTVYGSILTADSEACPQSNAVYIDNGEEDPNQCFAITPGNYFLGGKFLGGLSGGFVRVHFYGSAGCTGTDNGMSSDLGIPTGSATWITGFTDITAPANTASARIGVFGLQQYVDQLYVNMTNSF